MTEVAQEQVMRYMDEEFEHFGVLAVVELRAKKGWSKKRPLTACEIAAKYPVEVTARDILPALEQLAMKEYIGLTTSGWAPFDRALRYVTSYERSA